MLKKLLIVLLVSLSLDASNLDFQLYKKGEGENTLLVIGGIHGDEPGGYFSAAMLTKHYNITKGALWIVPNLNFDSIIRNRRGIYGDMNRKFDFVEPKDKDYKSVERIKSIIKDEKIDFILNLHDGRGFYREHWENALFNPSAWGQAFIIDQKKLDLDSKYKELDKFLVAIQKNINKDLSNNHHVFNIKDTKTKEKDEQMQQSLTYFAINNNKPAIAIETSKNIDNLVQKVMYQLTAIENIMSSMGIEYQRDFDLMKKEELQKSIYTYGKVKINGAITLDLNDITAYLHYFPLMKKNNEFVFEHPLGAVVRYKNRYDVMIGNQRVTSLYPQYFAYDRARDFQIHIKDGTKKQKASLGEIITLKSDTFEIITNKDIRVNVIGYYKKGIDNEQRVKIETKKLLKRFSISKEPQYRVEFYKEGLFLGTIMVRLSR